MAERSDSLTSEKSLDIENTSHPSIFSKYEDADSGKEIDVEFAQEGDVDSGDYSVIEFATEDDVESGDFSVIEFATEDDVESGDFSVIDFATEDDVESGKESDIDFATEDDVESGKDDDIESVKKEDVKSGKESDIEFAKEDDVESGKDDDIDYVKEENVESGKDSDIEFAKEEDVESGKDDNIGSVKEEDVESGKDSDIEFAKEEDVESGKDDNIGSVKEEVVESGKDDDIESVKEEDAASGKDSDIEFAKEDDVESGKDELASNNDVESGKEDDVESDKEDDVETVKDGDFTIGKEADVEKEGDIASVKAVDFKTNKDDQIEAGKEDDIVTVQDLDVETIKDVDLESCRDGKEGGIMGGDWHRVISRRRGATCSVEVLGRMKASEASVSLHRVQRQFCTGSHCFGQMDAIGMEGECLFTMPHEVDFDGEIHDGHFHGIGTLLYPNSCRIDGTFYMGVLVPATYTFRDGLVFELINWEYCSRLKPDRRFQQEIKFGLRPVCTSLKTQGQPTREIPEGCYDTGDGFYNPKTRCVTSVTGTIIRIPTAAEVQWIVQNCRKAWDEVAGFRRDTIDIVKKDDVNYAPLVMEERRKSLLGHERSAEDRRMRDEFCRLLGLT